MAEANRRTGRPQTQPSKETAPPRVRELKGSMFIDTAKGQFVDRREPPPTMTRREFEQEYARLVREFREAGENPGSISCKSCRNCSGCMFCQECDGCFRCTHCSRCENGSHLTHCQDCTGCSSCAYCAKCENCTSSSYLTLCTFCSDSTYCFGSIGLSKKDFNVLNVQYTKAEYFRIVKALQAEMGAPAPRR